MEASSGTVAHVEQVNIDIDGPAPVPADYHFHHGYHHQDPDIQVQKGRESPKPNTFTSGISMAELTAAQRSELRGHTLHRKGSKHLDHYFHGPRDLDKHSKWPTFLRMHGSIMPRLILPLTFMTIWSTVFTSISILIHSLEVSNILLTVLGFVVGLALSFRSSASYERYTDGRKYWATLFQTSRNFARTVWVSIKEREGEQGKEDLLGKVTALNLVLAFATALKHTLRFEPDIGYTDLIGLVGHLDTFAKDAHDPNVVHPRKESVWKKTGEYLGVSFAESNPRKYIKRAKKPLGHLSLEILNHLSAYIDHCVDNGTLSSALHQGQLINAVATLNEVLTGVERVRDTPLPEAYTIAISQISWIYILLLPFQLISSLGWLAIPGSVVATYIILSLIAIGRELEDPFGCDVNDLPIDTYCRQLAAELDIMTANPPPKARDFMKRAENLVLYPLSLEGYHSWNSRDVDEIRASLKTKVLATTPVSSGSASMMTVVGQESVNTKA